jgi:hypothetical protein
MLVYFPSAPNPRKKATRVLKYEIPPPSSSPTPSRPSSVPPSSSTPAIPIPSAAATSSPLVPSESEKPEKGEERSAEDRVGGEVAGLESNPLGRELDEKELDRS